MDNQGGKISPNTAIQTGILSLSLVRMSERETMIHHQYQVTTLRDASRFMMDFLSAWGVPLFYLVVFGGYLVHVGDDMGILILVGCASVYFALLWVRQKQRRAFRDFVERLRQAAEENGEILPVSANVIPPNDTRTE
jgi:hypothetical protein